jgi:hypothetical protein
MADGNHNNCFGLLVVNHTPVTHPKACARLTFQFLDIAKTRCRKGLELLPDAVLDNAILMSREAS